MFNQKHLLAPAHVIVEWCAPPSSPFQHVQSWTRAETEQERTDCRESQQTRTLAKLPPLERANWQIGEFSELPYWQMTL